MVVPLKEMGRENHRMMSNLPQQPPLASAANARFMVSWWDREIHIWSLRKPATELFESGTDDVDINQNRKLLKTIVVKGDCNITSAALNQDGTLLVVSTPIDVKRSVSSIRTRPNLRMSKYTLLSFRRSLRVSGPRKSSCLPMGNGSCWSRRGRAF